MFKRKSFRSLTSNNKGKWLAIFFTILAGLAVYLTLHLMFSPVPVIVAKEDIAESTIIEAKELEITKVAKRDAIKGTYSQIEDVAGNISSTPIFKGQQIIDRQINHGAGTEVVTPGEFKPNQTMISLTTQQAVWPTYLKEGDLVTIVAIYQDREVVIEEAVGRIAKSSSTSLTKHVKNLQQAQSSSPTDNYISFVTDIEGGKNVLLALKTSQMVYLMPRHSDLGGVD